MECSVCHIDKNDGVLIDGKVICKKCKVENNNKKKEGTIYYNISHRADKISVIQAKYKETDNYFIKLEADKYWSRYENRIKKGGFTFGTYLGGYPTKQEAVNYHYRNLEYNVKELQGKLTNAIKRFADFQDFISEEGFQVPVKEEIDIEI